MALTTHESLAVTSGQSPATTRAAINTSPEPFSNIAMSLVEDGLVVGTVWLATNHPLVFGVLLGGLPSIKLPSMGLMVAIYALVVIASKAGDNFKLRDVLILATILAAGSYLAFIVLLKLQMPVWPTFIAG